MSIGIFSFLDRPISWVYTFWIWGSRCDDFDRDCICCKKWKIHDNLFD